MGSVGGPRIANAASGPSISSASEALRTAIRSCCSWRFSVDDILSLLVQAAQTANVYLLVSMLRQVEAIVLQPSKCDPSVSDLPSPTRKQLQQLFQLSCRSNTSLKASGLQQFVDLVD